MTAVEQRTNAQIEHQLQEARRNFDNLKAKIAGFQGTLKGKGHATMQPNNLSESNVGAGNFQTNTRLESKHFKVVCWSELARSSV